MGEIKRMNLGGEPPMQRVKSVLTVSRDDLTEFVQFFMSRVPRETVILKGGYIFGELTGKPRYTADVDMSILELGSYDIIKNVLAEYGERLVAQGKCGEYKVLDEVVPGRRSGGVTYYRTDGTLLFSVDVSGSEVEFDTAVIDIPGAERVLTSTVEQVMSDKLSTLYSKKRFRRLKDLLDAHTICTTCTVDVERLRVLLERRGVWPLPATEYPFTPERIKGLHHAYERFELQDVSGNSAEKPDFFKVVEVVSRFLLYNLGVSVDTEEVDDGWLT